MRYPRHAALLACGLAAAVVTGLCLPSGAHAQSRQVRWIGPAEGLLTGSVRSLAQDSAGFLWFGTVGGLHRWDGLRLRHWAPGRIVSWVNRLTTCPNGQLFAVEEPGRLWEVTEDGVTPVPPPQGDFTSGPVTLGCDAASRIWVANWSRVWRREADGLWTEILPGRLLGQIPEVLSDGPGGRMWVHARQALWAVDSGGRGRIVAHLRRPMAVTISPRGDTLVLERDGALWRVAGGAARRIYRLVGRGMGMVPRGEAVYVAHDRFLVRLDRDLHPTVSGPDEFPKGLGPFILDREGSLWIGTPSGVLQIPEPETSFWTDHHGLPSVYTRFLVRQHQRIWVTTWQGTGYIDRTAEGWRAGTIPELTSATVPAVDRRGVAWIATAQGMYEVSRRGVQTLHPWPWIGHHFTLIPPGEGVWLAAEWGIGVLRSSDHRIGREHFFPSPTGGPAYRLMRTREGVLWVSGRTRVCHSREPFTTWEEVRWTCEEIPGAVELNDMVELPDGGIWIGSSRVGVLGRGPGGWAPLPGNATLPSRSVLGIKPARSGGVWLYGHGMALRVRPDSTSPEGWAVLERITDWQGVPANVFQDVLEEPDGTAWLATALGVARVPAGTRAPARGAPRVALVEARVGDSIVSPREALVLRFRHHQVEVQFAALSYRAPSLLRYQVRLSPSEQEWREVRGEPTFRWNDLPRGDYRAEVRASLDGRTWSAEPAVFAFRVRGPWYLAPWFLAAAAVGIAGTAALVYRARMQAMLRLERQRTEIAMDLHDELGSGLGAVGILAGLLANGTGDPGERGRLAREVMAISHELGTGLSNIVWSLDPRESTLAELGTRLQEHGDRLFHGTGTAFLAHPPDPEPPIPLGAAVRRALLLVGMEALHNAARHAGATRVTLTLVADTDAVELAVEDDGVGVANGKQPGSGRGLASMNRRTADVGGQLDITPRSEGGTRVRLRLSRERLANR